jgi:hypothetical protein
MEPSVMSVLSADNPADALYMVPLTPDAMKQLTIPEKLKRAKALKKSHKKAIHSWESAYASSNGNVPTPEQKRDGDAAHLYEKYAAAKTDVALLEGGQDPDVLREEKEDRKRAEDEAKALNDASFAMKLRADEMAKTPLDESQYDRTARKQALKKLLNEWEADYEAKTGDPPSPDSKKSGEVSNAYVSYTKIKDTEEREIKLKSKAARDKEVGGLLARLKAAQNGAPEGGYAESDEDDEIKVFAESIVDGKKEVQKVMMEIEKSKEKIKSLDSLKKDLKKEIEKWTNDFCNANGRQPNAAEKRDGSGVIFKSYWNAEEDLQKEVARSKLLLVKYEEEQYAVEDLENELRGIRHEKNYRPLTPEVDPDAGPSRPVTPQLDPFSELDYDQWKARKAILEDEVKKHQSGLAVLKGFIKTSSFQLDELKGVKNVSKNAVKTWVKEFQLKFGRDPSVVDKKEDSAARLFEEYTNAKNSFETLQKQRDEALVLETKTVVILESKLAHLEKLMAMPPRD